MRGRARHHVHSAFSPLGRKMDDFRARCPGAPARYRETSERSGCCGGAARPTPPGLSYKIRAWWGRRQWRGRRRRRSSSNVLVVRSLLGETTPPPSLAARGKGFPRGPCAAASCRSFCWRSSSAKRRGGRPPRCRRPERLRWPRCTRVATTGRWVSVRRAPVLGGTSQSQGAGLSAFLGPGYGGWLCSDLSTQTSPFSQNSTPPFPILESCQRLGSCGLVPWSFPALFTLPQCIRAGAQLSKTPDPKQRRSPSLRTYPTPPLIRHCSVGEQRWEAGSPSASIQPGIRDSDLRELGLRLCVGQSHRWGTRDRRACSGFQICSVSSA